MPVAAISFDAAGTFLHFAEPAAETYARFGRQHGLENQVGAIHGRMVAAFASAAPMAPHPDTAIDAYERNWWRRFASHAYNAPEDDRTFARCFDELFAYFAIPDAWRIHPGFAGLLEGLKSDGLQLAVISNFDGRLSGLLEAFGLSALFDHVILPRYAGCQKPEPGMFLHAASVLGVQPSELLHLGDHDAEDVGGAKAAGLQAMLWKFPIENSVPCRQRLRSRLDGAGHGTNRLT
ncbi:MAG: HAD family hydrolase [Mariprofundaceae bacterium]